MNDIEFKNESVEIQQHMHSIYHKVALLKQNLNHYEGDHFQGVSQQRNRIQTHNANESRWKSINADNKLKVTQLNSQAKINRQDLILNQRISAKQLQNQSGKNKIFSKTAKAFNNINILAFSTTNFSQFKNNSNRAKGNQQKTIFERLKTNSFSLNKRHFSSQPCLHNESSGIKKQGLVNKARIASEQNRLLNPYHKINRLTSFLDKNNKIQILKCPLHQELKLNKLNKVAGNFKMTNNKNQKSEQFYQMEPSQLDEITNEQIQQLKRQENELQDCNTFKPIGSAKITKRRNINALNKLSSFQNNFQIDSNQPTLKNKNTQNQQQNKIKPKQQAQKVKYLQKGARLRDILYKKLFKPEDMSGRNQMVYVRQYDQWVPRKILQTNRKQLQIYLQLLLGQKKKQDKSKRVSLDNIDIMYL